VNPQEGRKYEGIAFTFCKASTLAILAQLLAGPRFILPLIALGTTVWYIVAMAKGQHDTRCLFRKAWIAATFWGILGAYFAWRAWLGQDTFSLLNLLTGGRS
jgi:hypothetical protein